jgi:hypothetical protein
MWNEALCMLSLRVCMRDASCAGARSSVFAAHVFFTAIAASASDAKSSAMAARGEVAAPSYKAAI